MSKRLPYWRVDENLISVDFPQKPREQTPDQMAVEIFSTAFPSVFGFDDRQDNKEPA